MTFDSLKELKDFVFNGYCNSATPEEYEKFLADNADKHCVKGENISEFDDVYYSASELAELI